MTDKDRANLLHFCIVGASRFPCSMGSFDMAFCTGGGPTGVEFAAELHDLIASDIQRHYPSLSRMAKITLYDVAPKILGTFDKGLAELSSLLVDEQSTVWIEADNPLDRKSTRLNSSHSGESRMPSSA